MASLIRAGNTLLFSNPNDKRRRRHMTIKASTDDGLTWPAQAGTVIGPPSTSTPHLGLGYHMVP